MHVSASGDWIGAEPLCCCWKELGDLDELKLEGKGGGGRRGKGGGGRRGKGSQGWRGGGAEAELAAVGRSPERTRSRTRGTQRIQPAMTALSLSLSFFPSPSLYLWSLESSFLPAAG